jgi:hypothetical protein
MSLFCRPRNRKMNSAATFVPVLCASAFAIISLHAQEHVDVPLPPYDPPPSSSHYNQNRSSEPGSRSAPKTRPHAANAGSKKAAQKKHPYRKPKRTDARSTPHQDKHYRRSHAPRQRQKQFAMLTDVSIRSSLVVRTSSRTGIAAQTEEFRSPKPPISGGCSESTCHQTSSGKMPP